MEIEFILWGAKKCFFLSKQNFRPSNFSMVCLDEAFFLFILLGGVSLCLNLGLDDFHCSERYSAIIFWMSVFHFLFIFLVRFYFWSSFIFFYFILYVSSVLYFPFYFFCVILNIFFLCIFHIFSLALFNLLLSSSIKVLIYFLSVLWLPFILIL